MHPVVQQISDRSGFLKARRLNLNQQPMRLYGLEVVPVFVACGVSLSVFGVHVVA